MYHPSRCQTSTLASLLPCLDFSPCSFTLGFQLVITGTEFGDGLLSEKLLEGPLLNILSLVLLELGDELNSALQNRALVLLATRDDLANSLMPSLMVSRRRRSTRFYISFMRITSTLSATYPPCGCPFGPCAIHQIQLLACYQNLYQMASSSP